MTLFKNGFLALSLLPLLVVAGTGCSGSASKSFAGDSANSPSTSSGITVSSPANGASVGSPFKLVATASTCSSQPVSSMAFSIDNGADAGVVSGTKEETPVSSQSGTHTLHVKAWGTQGAVCNQDVTVAVTNSGSPENNIPSNATRADDLQNSNAWQAAHDPATGATSSGAMSLVGSPSMSGKARQFDTSFNNSGGEIYALAFGNDPNATHFFYDAWVYLTNSASNMANLELDMNQVLSNGQTVIYGFQCDGYSGTWDYTANQGTVDKHNDAWIHSKAPCNLKNWGKEQWHHVQISYSRDDSGNVTYHSVWLDGNEAQINATVPSAFALGWEQVLLTNFQVDGIGNGSNTVYLDKLSVSRW